MFESHPYRWSTIGSMEHLDTTLEDFKDFHKILHPQQCCLVVAGDFEKTKQKNGSKILWPYRKRRSTKKANVYPITQTIKATKTPTYKYRWSLLPTEHPMKTREARVLDFISSYLSDGRSSKLYKKVGRKKIALQIGARFSQEDYGMYIIYGLPMETHTAADLLNEIDEEIVKNSNGI
jgi:predicted Zn-dependent peptidase